MDADTRLLRAFAVVAEELHFGRAATRLFITQPALSQQIRKLERDLGITLFVRDRRRVALSEAGAGLLEQARAAVDAADEFVVAARQLRRVGRNELVVGFHVRWPDDLLTRAARAFRRSYPDVELEVRQYDFTDSSVGLRAGETDVGLLHLPVSWDVVEVDALFETPRVVMVADDHPLADAVEVDVATLLETTSAWAVPVQDDPAWRAFWSLEPERAALQRADVPTVRPDTMEALQQSVAMGGVIAITSAYIEEVYRPPGVRFLPVRGLAPAVAAIAWRRDAQHPLRGAFVAELHGLIRP